MTILLMIMNMMLAWYSITLMSITTYKPRYRYQIINKLKRTNM